jgi:hypothetical protein
LDQYTTKSSLSAAQRTLVDLLQRLNFGRVEGLSVCSGEPIFEPSPRVIQKLRMGGDNTPRPEIGLDDFWLKRPVIEMLEAIADLPDGVVLSIEAKYGLPFAIEVEQRPDAGH